MSEGWNYGLINGSMPGLLKIGEIHIPGKLPEDRAEELYKTGVPERFTVAFAFRSKNSKETEMMIHNHLAKYRHTGEREFFKISTERAIDEIESLIPGISWRSSEDVPHHYDKRSRTKTNSLERLIKETKKSIMEFVEFMKQNDYFESPYDGSNESNCRLLVREIGYLEEALEMREDFKRTNPELSKEDDKYMKHQCTYLLERIQYMKKKNEGWNTMNASN